MELPLALAGIGALVPEVIRLIQGQKQKKEGEQLDASLVRPELGIQDESKEALSLARMMATTRDAPGMTTAMEGVESTFGNAIAETQKFGGVDTAKLYDAKANALLGITDRNVAYRDNNMQGLIQALNNMAQEKKQVFDFNEAQPYYEGTAAAARLTEAGITNSFNAISNIGSGLVDTATLAALEKYLNPKTPKVEGE